MFSDGILWSGKSKFLISDIFEYNLEKQVTNLPKWIICFIFRKEIDLTVFYDHIKIKIQSGVHFTGHFTRLFEIFPRSRPSGPIRKVSEIQKTENSRTQLTGL